jgi:hypothetical protein
MSESFRLWWFEMAPKLWVVIPVLVGVMLAIVASLLWFRSGSD